MDIVNLQATNTASFVFSRIMSDWADVLPLASGKFRAHMRLAVDDPAVWYEWSSDNRRAAYIETRANGSFLFNSQPSPGDTLLLGASAVTFLAPGPPPSNVVVLAPTLTGATLTIGAPGVVNWTAHGLPAGTPVSFASTGNLPGPLAAGTIYYVSSAAITTNSFTIAATLAHAIAGDADLAFSGFATGVAKVTAPSTVLWANHGLAPNTPLALTSTGALPAPLTAVPVYVSQNLIETSSFQISAQAGGPPLFFGGSQSGTQTASVLSNSVRLGSGLPQTLENLVAALNASIDPQIGLCTYGAAGSGTLVVQYDDAGLAGNSFALGASSSGVIPSGPTLTGAGGLLTLTAPISDIENFLGPFVYDCRWESLDGQNITYLFGGSINFIQGVTRSLDMTTPPPLLALGTAVNIANLPTPLGDGDLILCADLGGGAGALEARGGVWCRLNESSYNTRADTFGTINLQVLRDANIQHFTATLTANVVVSLSSVLVYVGARFRVMAPPSLGGFTFVVQGISLSVGQYVDFLWNGTVWIESERGSSV